MKTKKRIYADVDDEFYWKFRQVLGIMKKSMKDVIVEYVDYLIKELL